MTGTVNGLHHVTAIAGSARRNREFHEEALGLRLVKKTVNFDDPGTWHLYYGDETGAPGTVMTFFPWEGTPRGVPGAGEVSLTQYSVPRGALAFWRDRLPAHGAAWMAEETIFGETRAICEDPDGLRFALVETDDPRAPWTAPEIGADVAIRGFRGVSISAREAETTARALTDAFGYVETAREGAAVRYATSNSPTADIVDLAVDPAAPVARPGAGSVHHVAFSVADRAAQLEVRARMEAVGLTVTPPIDRDYFMAIYARLPSGVLFEVATAEPGFDVDEPREKLGSELRVPARHAHLRKRIEAALPPLA